MLEFLDKLDKQIFLSINGCHSSFTDPVWVFISSKLFWLTLYIPVLILVLRKYRTRAFEIIVFAALLYLITDQGANFMKHFAERYRPCRDPDFSTRVHLLRDCSKYGFFSAHASNAFGQVVFLILLNLVPQKSTQKILAVSLIFWASLVAISRVFVGVHYPFDILAGAAYGSLCAWLIIQLRSYLLSKFQINTII